MKSNNEILDEINLRVHGHISVKKTLINVINRSKIRYLQLYKDLMSPEKCIPKNNCLLIGASGTGKTFLINELAKIMNFPFIMFDLTKLNAIGCSGSTLTGASMLDKIRARAKYLFEISQNNYSGKYFSEAGVLAQMIVFLDEIDKTTIDCFVGDWRYKIQTEMLSVFEGDKDFANLTVVAAGAFKQLTMDRKSNSSIGFHMKENDGIISDKKHIEEIDNELLTLGICPELLGRIGTICQLDIFTKDDFEKVFDERLYPRFLKDLSIMGINDFNIKEEQREKIINEAIANTTGIRGMQKQLNKLSSEIEFGADTLLNYNGKFNNDYRSEETYNNTDSTK